MFKRNWWGDDLTDVLMNGLLALFVFGLAVLVIGGLALGGAAALGILPTASAAVSPMVQTADPEVRVVEMPNGVNCYVFEDTWNSSRGGISCLVVPQ